MSFTTAKGGTPTRKQDYGTPLHIFRRLHEELLFTVDAAATDANAMLRRYWTIEQNALLLPWGGERVFCNPPYRNASDWIYKAASEGGATPGSLAALLIPATVETQAWQSVIFGNPNVQVRFLPKRIRYNGADAGASFASAIVIFHHPQEAPNGWGQDIRCNVRVGS